MKFNLFTFNVNINYNLFLLSFFEIILGDEDEIPSECLVSKTLLMELYSECVKLRSTGLLNRIPIDRLTKLINILERNIKDGISINLGADDVSDCHYSS